MVCGSCQPENGVGVVLGLGAGDHSLRFDVIQRGFHFTPAANPFGIIYSGELVETRSIDGGNSEGPMTPIPEPSAAMLFLVGAGLVRASMRRRA